MKGKVIFWKLSFRDYPAKLFGHGFIAPDGCKGNKENERVYFNSRSARYSPVRRHDLVEYELFESKSNEHPGRAAFKVEKVEQHEP